MNTSPLAQLTAPQFAHKYQVRDLDQIASPALLLFREVMEQNLASMIAMAGDPGRLRPHCKTHKSEAITRRELELGIVKHKCATLAEAEMLAAAGVRDILLAYNPVGPNVARTVALQRQYPQVRLVVTVDEAEGIEHLAAGMATVDIELKCMLDLDVGMRRTGVTGVEAAVELYRLIETAPALQPAGLHVYDGQNHQTDLAERTTAVHAAWQQATRVRTAIEAAGCAVPAIVAGGTGSFPLFAAIDEPILELSPGTPVLYDAGYSQMFPDLPFLPAALLLTRVVSRPGGDRLTLDLGYKAVASDPTVERRALFPSLPNATIQGQSEEHIMLATTAAGEYSLGDCLLAVPWHICPTVALHAEYVVIENGAIQDRWPVTARNRRLTI